MITDEEADGIMAAMWKNQEALKKFRLAERYLNAAAAIIEVGAHLTDEIGSDLLFSRIVSNIKQQQRHLKELQQ